MELYEPLADDTLATCVEIELQRFLFNCRMLETKVSPVLCFPVAPNPIICKFIRYFASIYNLTAIYLGSKEDRRLCVLCKSSLKSDTLEIFNELFSTVDEDTATVSPQYLRRKLSQATHTYITKQSRKMESNLATLSIDDNVQAPINGSDNPTCMEYSSIDNEPYNHIQNEFHTMYYCDSTVCLQNDGVVTPLKQSQVQYGSGMYLPTLDWRMSNEQLNITYEGEYFQPSSSSSLHQDALSNSDRELYENLHDASQAKVAALGTTASDFDIQPVNPLCDTEEEIPWDTHFVLNVQGLPYLDPNNLINIDDMYAKWILQYVRNPLIVVAAFNYESVFLSITKNTDCFIELYKIPRRYKTQHLLKIYLEGPRFIKWCDDNCALLITASKNQANRALQVKHRMIKSRPIKEGSAMAIVTACGTHFTPLSVYLNALDEGPATIVLDGILQEDKIFSGLIEFRQHNTNILHLNSLILQKCNLTKIAHLEGLVNLRELNLSYNEIPAIEGLTGLPNLRILDLNNNIISKIENLDAVPELYILHINYNNITKIEKLEKVPKLRFLELRGNQITIIENLHVLPNIIHLNLSDNFIALVTNLDSITNLTFLDLSQNVITAIDDVTGLVNLKTVYLHRNHIKDWTDFNQFSQLPKIEDIKCAANPFHKNF